MLRRGSLESTWSSGSLPHSTINRHSSDQDHAEFTALFYDYQQVYSSNKGCADLSSNLTALFYGTTTINRSTAQTMHAQIIVLVYSLVL